MSQLANLASNHLRTYLQRPDVLEQLKPLEEALKRFIDFFALVGLMIVKMAELPPSSGYEPLLIQYGVNRILARGMAGIVIATATDAPRNVDVIDVSSTPSDF